MSRLLDRRNARKVNVNGLRRDPRTGAGKLAKSERGYGGVLALDFTDNSAAVYDPATQANIAYSQGVTGGNGNLRGPHALLTYTSPSNKLTLQSDGFMKYQAHNLCLQSEDSTTTWVNLNSTDSNGHADLLGGANAFQILETADFGQHYLSQTLSHTGGQFRLRFYLKAISRDYFFFYMGTSSGSDGIRWRASTNTFDSVGTNFTAYTATDVGDSWWLIELTKLSTTSRIIFQSNDDTGAALFTGDTAKGMYIAFPQLIQWPANTDYIKTTTAAKYALPLEYDTSGTCLGLLVEEARTNLCLYSNDLTQAGSWTASNMTTAKTATGPDNVANSATTITASAGNATILQAITSASAARVTSVYIKRRTGTGNIDLTQDNGSTWTTQAVDSTWTRFSLSSVTSANPTVGIRIVTSGDAVDVALFSHEVGAFVTSPIITYSATATRAADNISIATSAFPYSATAMSAYSDTTQFGSNTSAYIFELAATRANAKADHQMASTTSARSDVSAAAFATQFISNTTVTAYADIKIASRWTDNDFIAAVNGTLGTPDVSGDFAAESATKLQIGANVDVTATQIANMHIRALAFVPRAKSDAELQAETT